MEGGASSVMCIAPLHSFLLDGLQEFTKEGRENSLTVHPISMGNDLSDAEIDGAARQLVETGLKVVVLATFETEISRILKRVKAVIDAAGQSYISYSWVVPTISTQDLLQTSMTSANVVNEDPSAPNLFEGMLGVNVRMPYSERVTMIKASVIILWTLLSLLFCCFPPSTVLPVVSTTTQPI
jgi:hypothetical protein